MSAPLDMVRSLLNEPIHVKLRSNRELRGTLHAFDEHCNLVLGNSEETVYDRGAANEITTTTNTSEMLFVRGDQVILIRR